MTSPKLEKSVSDAYQEIPVLEVDLDVPAKVQKLGYIVVYFKKEIASLQVLLSPNMPPEIFDVCKSAIEDAIR